MTPRSQPRVEPSKASHLAGSQLWLGEIDKATLRGFVLSHAGVDAMAGTGEHSGYRSLTRHGTVCRFVTGHVV